MSAPRPAHRVHDENGFVLALVLFVTAALGVTLTGALIITQSDHATARVSVDANRAFHIAQAGLIRFASDRNSARLDSAVYDMGGGTVVVRARRVATTGIEEIHEISSRATLRTVGRLSDVREVRQLAALELRAIVPVAAFATTARNVTLSGSYTGTDAATGGSCTASAMGSVAGISAVAGGVIDVRTATVQGNPRTQTEADATAMRARISAEWEELLDPATDFEFEIPDESWPNFAALPTTTYPTIRVRGRFDATAARSGRGLLVIDGAITLGSDFVWDGLIVAGDLTYPTSTNALIRGSLLTGLASNATATVNIGTAMGGGAMRIGYDSCRVLTATRRLARFRLLPNTWWEPGV